MGESDLIELLDHPSINAGIFFPRPDMSGIGPPGSVDLEVTVDEGVQVALRYHPAAGAFATVLHFHGNGEIAADYDDLAPIFRRMGAALICADYRGYGKSTGTPSLRGLVNDAHAVLDVVKGFLADDGQGGPLVVMGRSLGSAPAIELAFRRGADIAALIVESGFAQTVALLEHLGIRVGLPEGARPQGLDNEDKMARVTAPTLLLHAEQDWIVPPWHAEHNHERLAAADKRLVMIPNADHNNIMAFGGDLYWGSIAKFLKDVAG